MWNAPIGPCNYRNGNCQVFNSGRCFGIPHAISEAVRRHTGEAPSCIHTLTYEWSDIVRVNDVTIDTVSVIDKITPIGYFSEGNIKRVGHIHTIYTRGDD